MSNRIIVITTGWRFNGVDIGVEERDAGIFQKNFRAQVGKKVYAEAAIVDLHEISGRRNHEIARLFSARESAAIQSIKDHFEAAGDTKLLVIEKEMIAAMMIDVGGGSHAQ